ncbi:GTP-binding protein [Ruminococcus sp. 5_1_39BFAA]|uniref:GTP-binding protein n=1 Tax=Ruminococcus sp. 5_1_39BFAA TaxID=457412 RepID=UPI003561661C
MIKVDLITGFLGAGKTTFLKKYAKYLMDRGNRICILENDYGAVNVDVMLLQDLEGEQCELEMVSGGCDRDCHKRRFKTKLISMGMSGYDRVLIEPSGIFDVDEFFDVLYEEPLDRWYEIGNVIAVVDAKLDEKLSEESDYLLASEAANAGLVIFSKSQDATEEDQERTLNHLNRAMEQVRCKRRFQDNVLRKPWDSLTDEDWKGISSCGYVLESYEKSVFENDEGYTSLYFMNVHMTVQELRSSVKSLMAASDCGNIVRIKGFMISEDGTWIELNATHQSTAIQHVEKGQEIIIVIGEGLIRDKISAFFQTQTE